MQGKRVFIYKMNVSLALADRGFAIGTSVSCDMRKSVYKKEASEVRRGSQASQGTRATLKEITVKVRSKGGPGQIT